MFFSRGGNCFFFKRFLFLSITLSVTLFKDLLLVAVVLVLEFLLALLLKAVELTSFFLCVDVVAVAGCFFGTLLCTVRFGEEVRDELLFALCGTAVNGNDGESDCGGNDGDGDGEGDGGVEEDEFNEGDGDGEGDEDDDVDAIEPIDDDVGSCVATIFGLIFGLRVDVPVFKTFSK